NTTSGASPALAISSASVTGSLSIRTASRRCPASVTRTITERRRCRSIPTTCLPSYASTRGLLRRGGRDNPQRTTAKGDCHEERKPPPLIASGDKPVFGAPGRFRRSETERYLPQGDEFDPRQ